MARFRITARREVITEDEVTVDIEARSQDAAEQIFDAVHHDDLVDVPTFRSTNEWDTSGDWYVYEVEELDDGDEDCGVVAKPPGVSERTDAVPPEVTVTKRPTVDAERA